MVWHMIELLQYPEVQSGVVPFFVSLLVAFIFRSRKLTWACAGVVLAFISTALLLNGFTFLPLSGTRKIILAGMLVLIIAGFSEAYLANWRYRLAVLVVISGLLFLWVVWPVLLRMEGSVKWLIAAGGVSYVIWHTLWLDSIRKNAMQSTASVLALGLGTGGVAIFGASALYGQLSISMGAAAGALLFFVAFSKLETNTLLTYPASVLTSLLGMATLVFADLPWYALVLLTPIPLLARIPVPERYPAWIRTGILVLIVMLPVALALLSVGNVEDDSPY